MRRPPLRSAVLAVVALAVGTAACGSSTETRSIDVVKVGDHPASFEPETITVDKSDDLEITVGNQTTTEHGFSIEGYGVREVVPPGQEIDVKLTAGKSGTYKIYCQLHPTHLPATLIVQ